MASRRRRPLLVSLLVLLTWVFVTPALAQEDDATTTTVAESGTTVAESPATTSGLVPAVPIEDEPEAAAEPDWTYRYLLPTALVITVLIVVVTSIKYFSDVVRKRYRVVEE